MSAAKIAVGIALGLALWVVLSSVLFGALAQAPGFNDPRLLWMLASDAYGRLQLFARVSLLAPPILAVALVAPLVLKKRSLHGDARWARSTELRKAGLLASQGIVLARRRGRLLIAGSPGHVLAVAPTGSGKGVGWVIPTLLQYAGSAIVLDPKRENWEITAGHRSRSQAVFLFDPYNPAGSPMRWNPLAFLVGSEQPIDELSKVAEILIPTPEGSDPHWTASARSLFIGAGLHLHSVATVDRPLSIGQILTFILDHGDQTGLTKLLKTNLVRDPTALSMLRAQANRPGNEAGSVVSTLRSALAAWEIPSVVAATEENDVDLRTLRRTPATIYLAVPPDNIVRGARMLALFWQQVMDALTRSLPAADEKHEVLMLMDEFTLPGPMKLIKDGLGFLRGYKVRVMVVCQSLSQLVEVYGEAGKSSIVENCRFRVHMAPNDERTAQALSNALGNTTVKGRSLSVSGGFVSAARRSKSFSDQRRPLMLPQEILMLGEDRLIISVEGMPPVLANKIRFYKDRVFSRRVTKPPAVSMLSGPGQARAILHGDPFVQQPRLFALATGLASVENNPNRRSKLLTIAGDFQRNMAM